ncbi:MAG: hypothetical protein ACOX6T_16125 [Myxococcales bacterium]|jgi:hypothetical protein
MKVTVLYHDGCFDGAASAAVFTRFFRERVEPGATFSYRGLSHKDSGPIDEQLFDGDQNAIVDFRYSTSPKLTWWFDHHVSAFPNPGEEASFRADTSGKKFYDPTAKSCTGFLASVARERFGFDPTPMADLIHWAEIIDGALFPDAHTAVVLEQPALKLMLVIEANPGPSLLPRLIGDMQHKSLNELVRLPYVAEKLDPLYEKHMQTVELVRRRAKLEKGVVFFDVADEDVGTLNKFIAYDLFPEARYAVAVTCGPGRAKISVGSNPWRPELRTHDLARICERYGGGGHPVVGAVSHPPDQLERARREAAEIVRELQES